MKEADNKLRQAIKLIIESGYQVDSNTLNFLDNLSQRTDVELVVSNIVKDLTKLHEKPLFLTKEFLEDNIKEESINELVTQKVHESVSRSVEPYAKEIESRIEIIADIDEKKDSQGSIEDFLRYFKDRFTKIEKIIRERTDVKDAVTIETAIKSPINSKIKTIGIVMEKRERSKSVLVQLEDFKSNITVIVPFSTDRRIVNKARRLVIDQVVCVEAKKINEDLFIATNFISPDIPERRIKTASEEVYAVLTSDIHVGSKKFLTPVFDRFIRWLNGNEGNNHQKEIASKVKYLVIAGDLVDGIGVYPNHEKELEISDIYKQYSLASKLIEKIPEYIEVVIIPGNHDATRQALPQPAILQKYAKPLYRLRNVRMLGDPSRIRLHGVDLLIYHGRSLDDIIGSVPDVSYQNLEKDIPIAMKYFLKTRHLAPIYGSKTPIAPVQYDSLVIESAPDVLHMGHVHVIGYESYRGTLLINSGTWQDQTDFQKKMGLLPNPGIVPIVNLQTSKIMPIDFTS